MSAAAGRAAPHPDAAHAGLRVAYVVSEYPAPSHTFVQREIHALEALGVAVTRCSIRPGDPAGLRRAGLTEEAARTLVVRSRASLRPGLRAAARLLARPRALGRLLLAGARRAGRDPRAQLWNLFYLAEALVVWERCRERGVRVVHAHFGNVAADVARLAAELGRAVDGETWRWSLTLHGPYDFVEQRRLRLAAKVADADRIVCISDYARSQVLPHLPPERRDDAVVVRCGIEVGGAEELDRPSSAPAPGTAPLVATVARLAPDKGLPVLLEAVAALARRGVEVRAEIAGGGPDAARLADLAAALGVADRVRFLGVVGQREVQDLLGRAEVFVLPSFLEGLPVALMEAMERGVPVVATRVAAVGELVVDGESGWLVPAADADALADAIADALARPGEGRRRAGAARKAVHEAHDVRANAAQLAAVFRELAAEPQP